MARRLRIQFPGARYHVINRGNLQHDIFATSGACQAFLGTLAEACQRFGWRTHAQVIMRNHYHLALETPDPNLVEGMHWLLSTFAIRLTRYHEQHGHVFQGRYKSLLIEDDHHVGRVCDYIHLNPVRARAVPVDQLASFKWSSLRHWLEGNAPPWLEPAVVLAGAGLSDRSNPWTQYTAYLARIATGGNDDERMATGSLSCRRNAGDGVSPLIARSVARDSRARRLDAPSSMSSRSIDRAQLPGFASDIAISGLTPSGRPLQADPDH